MRDVFMYGSSEGENKAFRLLSMFERLSKGEKVAKKTEAERFGVTTKTIQRDIEELNDYISLIKCEESAIEYIPRQKGYILKRDGRIWLNQEEVLGIVKVLLEGRAFNKREMNILLDKLVAQCEPEDRRHITNVVKNERFHFVELQHQRDILKTIWDVTSAIKNQQLIKITYNKVIKSQVEQVERIIEPQGVLFSEFYFYMFAYIQADGDKLFRRDFPAVYRLDRIQSYDVLLERFAAEQRTRLEEGEFRKKVQFMKQGKLQHIQFRFWGDSLEAVLDRLPNAKVVSRDNNEAIIEAEVYGEGIKMWLLSQAQFLEIIRPAEFRSEMKDTIRKMLLNYE